MFCGFGAVVLLVLIINSNTVTNRQERLKDLRLEVERLELERTAGQTNFEKISQLLQQRNEQIAEIIIQQQNITSTISLEKTTTSQFQQDRNEIQKEIEQLQKNVRSLEKELTLQTVVLEKSTKRADSVRKFEGAGNRQYLTGLKLGGKRVLVLLDSSASMLDKTVVNIIRRRVLDDTSKRNAPKWMRAVRTVRWILAKLPSESTVKLATFNTEVNRLLPPEGINWVKVTDSASINSMLDKLSVVVPSQGTSLENCFRYIKNVKPAPDNIILITDGLPTQGQKPARKSTITGAERVKLFLRAAGYLPEKTPVNTILFPMEGDPMAAMLFWKLAVDTSGSFFTPTQDWP